MNKIEDLELPSSSSSGTDSDLSSSEGDLLPDEEDQDSLSSVNPMNMNKDLDIAVRLIKWLAKRVGSQPGDIFPEVADLFLGDILVATCHGGSNMIRKALPDTPTPDVLCSPSHFPSQNPLRQPAPNLISNENDRI